MKVWMLCEAFTLTGDAFGHQTVHESLTAWGLPCASRKAAMRELRQCVRERVIENYEGLDDADDDIRSDIDEVLSNPTRRGGGTYTGTPPATARWCGRCTRAR